MAIANPVALFILSLLELHHEAREGWWSRGRLFFTGMLSLHFLSHTQFGVNPLPGLSRTQQNMTCEGL